MSNKSTKLTLGQYVRRRNGVPMGASGSLKNMLKRSFSARSPRVFWQYWNPIFGYYLGTYIFIPLKKILPSYLALLLTFMCNGLIHDLIILLFGGSLAGIFTIWFFFLGIGVIVTDALDVDLSSKPRGIRIFLNVVYLLICLVITIILQQKLNLYF
ncbi:MAG: acyltransferase [Balneolaceae bacterium]|nr:acyltransferase [Balneolaceae bacterium]